MINKLLDLSIIFNFDKTGFKRHAKSFKPLCFPPESIALITGGTSGIGKACALELIKNNVQTFITGRDPHKGKSLEQEKLSFIQNDLTQWSEIKELVSKLPKLSYLVLNAGGMPDKDSRNEAAIESQAASQLFGHYYLLKELVKQNKLLPKAKVVWVTSGGMYLKKFDFDELIENTNYDKVSTYANVKRAQVLLLQTLKKMYPEFIITAMHPGWVDTPAVRNAIPGFFKVTQKILRTPSQGADTILWLLAHDSIESGRLYFDRKQVTANAFWFTKLKHRNEIIQKLISFIDQKAPN
jgi:dehydrogenase/reductase SDR family protein 12